MTEYFPDLDEEPTNIIQYLKAEIDMHINNIKYYRSKLICEKQRFERLEESKEELNTRWAKKREKWDLEYVAFCKQIKALEGTDIDELGCKASELNIDEKCKIYLIEDQNGKKYVGQTTQPIICRYIQHLKTDTCSSNLLDLKNSVIKCIDVCDIKDKLKVEKEWIDKIDCVNKNCKYNKHEQENKIIEQWITEAVTYDKDVSTSFTELWNDIVNWKIENNLDGKLHRTYFKEKLIEYETSFLQDIPVVVRLNTKYFNLKINDSD